MYLMLLLRMLLVIATRESWIGEAIVVKKSGIQISNGAEPHVHVGTLDAFVYRVTAERGEKIKVKARNGIEGWLDKSDAVLLRDAFDHFSLSILQNPDDSDHYLARGEAALATGDYDIAIKDASRAIRLKPGVALAHANRGEAWAKKNNYDKAIADSSEAIRLDPKFVDAYVTRGAASSFKKDYDQSIADCTAAIRLDPGNLLAYYNRANAWKGKGNLDKAISDYGEAIRIDPRCAFAFTNRGNAWADINVYEKAIADHEKAIRLNPAMAISYARIAHICATCPDPLFRDGKRALENAKQALELDKDNPVIMSVLAAAYAETFEYVQAVHWQERVLAFPQFRNDPHMKYRLGLYRMKTPYRER